MASASYSDIKINIKTSVDSSGIKEATKELNQLNAAQTAVAKGADKVSSKMDKVLKTTTSSKTSEVVNELPRSTSSQIVDTAKETATHVRIIERAAETARNEIRKTQEEMRRDALLHDYGGLNGRSGARAGLIAQTGKDYLTGNVVPPSYEGQSGIDEMAANFSSKSIIIANAVDMMRNAFSALGKGTATAISAVGSFASSIGGKVLGRIKSFTKGLSNIVNAFKRIAFYRFVRTVIKEITEGFREGVQNLYQWSKLADGEFAKSMDTIATSMLYMKNSLGAMVAPLINAIAPVIDYLVDRFVDLLNIINQVFAALTNATSWTKAIKYPHEYAKAAKGAGSAAHKLGLAQIDQLTILDKHKGSSGSGFTSEDYAGMFEKKNLAGGIWDKIKQMVSIDAWRGIGLLLAQRLNEIVEGLDTNAWGKALGTKITHGIELAYGFLKNVDFVKIGTKVGEFINGSLETINFDTLGRLLVRKMTALWDFLIGAVTSIDWGLVGKSISNLLVGKLDELTEWARDVDWMSLSESLWHGLEDMVGAVDYSTIASRIFELLGIALGAAIEFILTPIFDVMDSIAQFFTDAVEQSDGSWLDIGSNIVNGILEGIWNVISGIGEWIYTNVFDPFVKGINEAFGIHSPAATMIPIGENIVAGIKEGAKKKWEDILQWFRDKWNSFKSWWSKLSLPAFQIKKPHLSWSTQPAGGWIANILSTLGLPTSLPKLNVQWYANGGFPEAGQLFVASERGPELVGSMNGRTAVANNDQIVAGISQGVYEAVRDAMGDGNQAVNVYLDGKQISGSVVKNINSETRRTGSSPLLSY